MSSFLFFHLTFCAIDGGMSCLSTFFREGLAMKLQYKAALIVGLIGACVLLVSLVIHEEYSHSEAIKDTLRSMVTLTDEVALRVGTVLEKRVEIAKTTSTSRVLEQVLMKSNAKFGALSDDERKQEIEILNAKWMETDDINSPFIQAYLTNPAAVFLNKQREMFPDIYGEIFLTNRFGAMIATTGKLTTLAHAHKYWWVKCFDGGRGKVFLDDRGFDTSVQGYVLGIVVPVKSQGQVIGILKSNVNIMGSLNALVSDFSMKGDQGNLKIARSGGLVVVERGKVPLSTRLPESLIEGLSTGDSSSATAIDNNIDHFVAYAPIEITMGSDQVAFGGKQESVDHTKGNTGEAWHAVVFCPEANLAAKVHLLSFHLMLIGLTLILVMAGIAMLFGRRIAKPIADFASAARSLGEGYLDTRIKIDSRDEIGSLANSFNTMVDNLKETMASRDELSYEVEQRLAAEIKLVDSEERFRLMMEQSPSVIELYDLDGLQVEVNRAYEELWGFPASQTVNKFNVLKSKEVVDTGLIEYLNRAYAGEAIQVPIYQFDPTGETESGGRGRVRWLSTRIYPLKDSSGNVCNIVITHEDITDKKQAEEAFKRSSQLAAAGQMASGIAHEINNPLATILACAEVMQKDFEAINMDSPQLRKLTDYTLLISDEASRASGIIGDLLDFTRHKPLTVIKMDLCDVTKKTAHLFEVQGRYGNYNFQLSFAEKLPMIEADKNRVRQVIIILLTNAVESMPDGGVISINCNLDSKEECVILKISDEGIGIAEENLQDIFEPFYTSKMEGSGTGLGLSIAQEIIEKHNGVMEVQSTMGEGSTFSVKLPC